MSLLHKEHPAAHKHFLEHVRELTHRIGEAMSYFVQNWLWVAFATSRLQHRDETCMPSSIAVQDFAEWTVYMCETLRRRVLFRIAAVSCGGLAFALTVFGGEACDLCECVVVSRVRCVAQSRMVSLTPAKSSPTLRVAHEQAAGAHGEQHCYELTVVPLDKSAQTTHLNLEVH